MAARAWSPSSLQQFAVCPYKFALHGIYRLRPREEAAPLEQMDPLTRGALFHEVQFALLGELQTRGIAAVNAERLTSRAGSRRPHFGSDRGAIRGGPGAGHSARLEDRNRGSAHGSARLAATVAQNDGDWEPLHFEFAFGLAGARRARSGEHRRKKRASRRASACAGRSTWWRRHFAHGALRVTDHKTGKLPETHSGYTGGGRVLQPLLYALAAEQLLGGTSNPGDCFTRRSGADTSRSGFTVNPGARQFLAKLLANIDDAIASGFLPPVPEKDACGICDYRAVCGPYEEQRAARQRTGSDERLDGLHEIRGFL